jgi:hypothetical protein
MRNVIYFVRTALIEQFKELDKWFDHSPELLSYKPEADQWNIREVLEHIALTNYFLLLTINKATQRALNRRVPGVRLIASEAYKAKFREIETISSKSFGWVNPAHLEPEGLMDLPQIRKRLKQQFTTAMYNLSLLSDGSGTLVKTNLHVNNLGALDIYQYIFFLTRHIVRHQHQMISLSDQYAASETELIC